MESADKPAGAVSIVQENVRPALEQQTTDTQHQVSSMRRPNRPGQIDEINELWFYWFGCININV